MELPVLPYDFCHAFIEEVRIGPRHEVTITISPLVWSNHQGHHIAAVPVRFGGIINFEEVSAFFEIPRHSHTDLARLQYDLNQQSKPGSLFFELIYERVDANIVIHCRNFSVTPIDPPALAL